MVRRFDPRPLPAEVVDRILHSATRAPSAGFSQGVDLLVLEGPEAVQGFWRATADPRFGKPYSAATPAVVSRRIIVPPPRVPIFGRGISLGAYNTAVDRGPLGSAACMIEEAA